MSHACGAARCGRRVSPTRVTAHGCAPGPVPAVPQPTRPPTGPAARPGKPRLARRPRPATRGAPAAARPTRGELPRAARPHRRPPPPAGGKAGSAPGYARARLGEGVPGPRRRDCSTSPRPAPPGLRTHRPGLPRRSEVPTGAGYSPRASPLLPSQVRDPPQTPPVPSTP